MVWLNPPYRYGSEEMRRIFTKENWLQKMLDIEAALAKAHAEVGNIPREAAEYIASKASTKYVTLQKISEIEREIHHETMAVVKALADECGDYGGYVHLGATSNDILDTAMALQLKDALKIVKKDLIELAEIMIEKAETYKNTICLGRTHGIAAIVMPFGFKFTVWLDEIKRHLERLEENTKRDIVGKMSGAVGTMAALGEKGIEIQKLVMKYLGLKEAEITTQIVSRDRLAEIICLISMIASTLDKIANEIRNLQRTEIREVEEPFTTRQVGSSTMPHKRNPIRSEKVCGLAKVIRGYAVTALENIVLEHERDLTNSSCERIMIPEIFLLLDEQLKTLKKVLKGLVVYPENMKRNIEATKGLIMSEAVMIAMVKKGANRQWAHEVIRNCAMKAWQTGKHLLEILRDNPEIRKYLSEKELEEVMKPENYLGASHIIMKNVLEDAKKYLMKLREKLE